MAARRAGKMAIDWARLSTNVPEHARGDFLAFKGRYEAQKAKMNAISEKPEPIDWNFYKSYIPNKELVENFQKQYDALKLPYPEDTESAGIAAWEKKVDAEAAVVIQEAMVENLEFREELEKLKAEKPYEEMTVHEYLEDKPELQAQIKKDMLNYKFD